MDSDEQGLAVMVCDESSGHEHEALLQGRLPEAACCLACLACLTCPESEFDLQSGLDKYPESEFDLSSGLGFSKPLDKYLESEFVQWFRVFECPGQVLGERI